ncbi:MAG: hypothetical protein ABWY18_16270 [Tardiphaga sp.]
MRQPAARRPLIDELQIALREPAGLVCVALLIAVALLAARIAVAW